MPKQVLSAADEQAAVDGDAEAGSASVNFMIYYIFKTDAVEKRRFFIHAPMLEKAHGTANVNSMLYLSQEFERCIAGKILERYTF